jgi:hypothetical protein
MRVAYKKSKNGCYSDVSGFLICAFLGTCSCHVVTQLGAPSAQAEQIELINLGLSVFKTES